MPKHEPAPTCLAMIGVSAWVLMATCSGPRVKAQVLREPEMIANNRCT